MKNVKSDDIEKWLIRKTSVEQNKLDGERNSTLSKWKFCVHKDKRSMLEKLTNLICENTEEATVLYELGKEIAKVVKASSWNLYIVDETEKLLTHHCENTNESVKIRQQEIATGETVAAFVARTHETLYTKEVIGDDRFPAGTGKHGLDQSVICHPILHQDKRKLYGVLEFIRDAKAGTLGEEDFEIITSYLSWAAILVRYARLSQHMNGYKKINTFALQASRLLLNDEENPREKMYKLLGVCQEICACDYFMKFDRDNKCNEIISTETNICVNDTTKYVYRYPINKGIAGYILGTGKSLNIKDAYSDERFLREMDQQTGLKSITFIAFAVHDIAINTKCSFNQLSNKRNGVFNENDEKILELCALYTSHLHEQNLKLKDFVKKENEVCMLQELVEFHTTPRKKELLQLAELADHVTTPEDFDRYCFNHYEENHQFSMLFVKMAKEILADCNIICDDGTLVKFTGVVKHFYRPQPYHNWVHAFSVAHFMYLILSAEKTLFTPLEKAALFFACVCHDMDHRGRNNAFVQHSKSPLAVLYPDGSCLEYHHYYLTQHILEREGCNIFKNLDRKQRLEVDEVIQGAILATDLIRYFGYRGDLENIVHGKTFDWNFKKHRDLTAFLMMTLCDLCGSCKPWEIHCISVAKVFEEFYAQADEEIEMGVDPIPMFVNKEDLPLNQIGFLNAVVMPCVKTLQPILPTLSIVEEHVSDSISRWESIIKTREEDKDQLLRYGTPVEEKLEQLKLPGSKLQENSLSFVKYTYKK